MVYRLTDARAALETHQTASNDRLARVQEELREKDAIIRYANAITTTYTYNNSIQHITACKRVHTLYLAASKD
jgi:hypothetical protein